MNLSKFTDIIKMAHPKAISKETSFPVVEVMVTFFSAIIPLHCVWLGGIQELWKMKEGKWSGKLNFPLFGNGKKTGGVENPGENFLSQAHKFFPSKSGGKAMRENCLNAFLP